MLVMVVVVVVVAVPPLLAGMPARVAKRDTTMD